MPFTLEYANKILTDTVIDESAWMGLHGGVPSLANELVGLSYGRQLVEFSEPDGFVTNTNVVSFGPMTSYPLGAQFIGIWDSRTEGTCIYFAQIVADQTAIIPINSGDTISWIAGEITLNAQGG